MSTNPKELQKFLDLWSPVVTAIPAVINALEREAELERHVASMEVQLVQTQNAIDAALQDQQGRVTEINGQIEALTVAKAQAVADIEAVKASEKAEVAAASKAARERLAATEAKVADAGERLAGLDAELRQRLADADRDFLTHKQELDALIQGLEDKKAQAQAALDALRVHLG